MKRIVEPELLDELPPGDPQAIRSRRDLRRINAWMRHHAIMAGALKSHLNGRAPEQIIELGAGDGNFLLRVAQKTSARWPKVNVTLLDRQKIVKPDTLSSFTSLGWRADTVTTDVLDWSQSGRPAEVVVANLFLHHFNDASLSGLFRSIAARAQLLIALEPRRGFWPLCCSQMLGAIGCNYVTRYDAVLSVRAGFNRNELSRLWPSGDGWQLTERSTGLFSHLFIAQRTGSK